MRRQSLANVAILAGALGSLGVVWLTREVPTTAQLAERHGKLLPTFDKTAVTRLTLSQDGREVALEATSDGEFRIARPWRERADVASVNQLLGALDLAAPLRVAEGVSPSAAGLTSGALRIQVEAHEKTQVLVLGGPAPAPSGARYVEVRATGETKRYVVSQGVVDELSMPLDKFREPRLLGYGRSDFAGIAISNDDETVEFSQDAQGAFFVRVGDARELAERDVVERVLSALARLSTEHFVEVDSARSALAGARQRVKLNFGSQALAPVTLTFGVCPGSPSEALVLKEQPDSGARAGCVSQELALALRVKADEARLLGPFAARADEVEVLSLSAGQQKLELARKDRAFVLRTTNREVPLEAGNDRISAILSARGRRTARAEARLAPKGGEMAIDVASGSEGAHRSERVLLGSPGPDGGVCLERVADQAVLCFERDAARAFGPDATDLKGLTLFDFAPSQVATLSVTSPGLREVVRRNPDGGYTLEEPRGYRHDGALVGDLLQSLGTLRALRWLEPGRAVTANIDSPRLEVSVTLTGDSGTRTLRVGAPTSGGYVALASADPSPFVLPSATFDELATPLIDRSLVPFPEAELTRIQLEGRNRSVLATRNGEKWSGPLSSDTIEAILALRADRALHLGAAKPAEGFAKPTLVVRFGSKQGQEARLSLGLRDASSEAPVTFCRLDGVDATFALADRTATMLRDSLASAER